jgi:hypothetical protein
MLVGVHATPNIVAMDSHIKESDAPLSTGPSELRRTFPSESRNSTGAKMSFDPEGEGGQWGGSQMTFAEEEAGTG